MSNSQKGKIILVDRTEVSADGYGSYLKIYDMGGETHRIAEKRSALWDLFRNARQWTPVMVIYETYKNNEYIADARDITDELLKGAIRSMGEKIVDKGATERNRSQSVSYAKDLAVAGTIPLEDLFDTAIKIYRYITTGQTLPELQENGVVVEKE